MYSNTKQPFILAERIYEIRTLLKEFVKVPFSAQGSVIGFFIP